MTIGIFTVASRGDSAGDTFNQSLACYKDFADEVYVNDRIWPLEFSWDYIGKSFQAAYEMANTAWVLHMDLDFLFHERDFGKIRQALKDYPNAPAISFYKWQFILPDRYNLKSRLVLAVNKKVYSDRIKFNGGGDLCQPTLDGQDLNLDELPQAGVPFYNYEKLIKTEAQVRDDVERMDRAYHRYFGKWLYSNEGKGAYEGWLNMVVGRFHKPSKHIKLYEHPKYIQETIKNLTPDQFGYSAFGLLGENDYVKSSMHSR